MENTTDPTSPADELAYLEYFNYVVDCGSALDAVADHDLFGLTRTQLLRQLKSLEEQAADLWFDGMIPESWDAVRGGVADELEAANVLYVVWGTGQNKEDLDEDPEPEMVKFTPWADRSLVGEEWVATWFGDLANLEGDPSVAGYRKLERSEVLQWRRGQRSAAARNRTVP